jgi:hypothetical protein
MVNKHTDRFNMINRQMIMKLFTHEMTKTKQTKIIETRKKCRKEVGEVWDIRHLNASIYSDFGPAN